MKSYSLLLKALFEKRYPSLFGRSILAVPFNQHPIFSQINYLKGLYTVKFRYDDKVFKNTFMLFHLLEDNSYLNIRWTGETRFDPNKLNKNKLFKIKLSKSSSPSSIHTHGNIIEIDDNYISSIKEYIDYIVLKTGMIRLIKENIYGKSIIFNPLSHILVEKLPARAVAFIGTTLAKLTVKNTYASNFLLDLLCDTIVEHQECDFDIGRLTLFGIKYNPYESTIQKRIITLDNVYVPYSPRIVRVSTWSGAFLTIFDIDKLSKNRIEPTYVFLPYYNKNSNILDYNIIGLSINLTTSLNIRKREQKRYRIELSHKVMRKVKKKIYELINIYKLKVEEKNVKEKVSHLYNLFAEDKTTNNLYLINIYNKIITESMGIKISDKIISKDIKMEEFLNISRGKPNYMYYLVLKALSNGSIEMFI